MAAEDGRAPRAGRSWFWSLYLGTPRTRHDHLDALDGLRGLAVLIVLGSHLSNTRILPWPGLSGWGKSGVYLFFVLSAFLLARPLLQRPPSGFADPRLWGNYALRRVLRIWPLYLVVLLSAWGLTMSGATGWHYRIDNPSLLRHLRLAEGQSVLWSIPVEFTFYLWLPLLALGLSWLRQRRWPIAVELAILALLVGVASWRWPPSATPLNDVRLGPYLPVFLCGAFAALLDVRLGESAGDGRRPVPWTALAFVAGGACLLGIPSLWAWLTGGDFNPLLSQRWFTWFGAAWAALLLAILHGPPWLRAPFASRPLRLVGVVSFSAYLWHMPVLDLLRAAGVGRWPWLAPWLVLGAVLAVSMLSFLLLERPWREVRLPLPPSARARTEGSG